MCDPDDWKGWKRNRYSGVSRHRRNRDGPKRSRDETDDGSSSSNSRPRRPPGLRGKEIGLWYRNNRRRSQPREVKPFQLVLDPEIKQEIKEFTDNCKAIPPAHLVKKYAITLSSNDSTKQEPGETAKCSTSYNSTSINNLAEKYNYLEESRFKASFLKSITGSIDESLNQYLSLGSALGNDPYLNEKFRDELLNKNSNTQYVEMMKFRMKLPSYEKRKEIVNLVASNQVVVINGETGCGKTTQVAQFILDNAILEGNGSTCFIICTQPRRISAISVAERVAEERGELLGQDVNSVGYQIRLEKNLPRKKGSILYCTTGVLLQFMQSNPAVTFASHIIIDEIHERDTISDFSITILKDVLSKRRDLKLILMSATLNAERFSKYYNDCPMLTIPGFTFPVQEFYLEDILELISYKPESRGGFRGRYGGGAKKRDREYVNFIEPYVRNLERQKKYSRTTLQALMDPSIEDSVLDIIFKLICHICYERNEPGAILVFLPGWDQISDLYKRLNDSGRFPNYKFNIIPLHSMMPTASQKKIFERPPLGVRKIVIATNIAETSITIDDIVFVIDSGKIKMKNFDIENKISTLQPEWVSLANARQRRGRAGRVQEGVCYHLFSRAREMSLADYPLPEMLRTRLEEVILKAKILQLGSVRPFLQKVMDPPDPVAIDISLKVLVSLNALDDNENLTPLGYHLAQLPLDPQTGKMILMGALFKCVDPIFTIAASLSFKDAFIIPLGKEGEVDEKRIAFDLGRKSDHLMIAEAFAQWEQSEHQGWGRKYCRENFLARNTLCLLRDMKKQFTQYLYDMQFLTFNDHKEMENNINSDNTGLLRAIICSGLYPNVAIIRKTTPVKRKTGKPSTILHTEEDGRVVIHPKSVNANALGFESKFLLYFLKLKTTSINLYDTTMVHALPLIFFGHSINTCIENGKTIMSLTSRIKFEMEPLTAKLITDLRIRLDWLLEEKISNPDKTNWNNESEEGRVLRAITKLITFEDKQLMEDDYDDDSLSLSD